MFEYSVVKENRNRFFWPLNVGSNLTSLQVLLTSTNTLQPLAVI